MTSGDIGTIILVSSGGFVMTGGVATLLVQLQTTPAPTHTSYTMTIQPGGLTATYSTVGTEFPIGGVYNLALQVVIGGTKFTSQMVTQHVNPLILP